MRTDHFIRFERVDSVEETASGLLARLHGEQLRVDAVRPDVVRVQLSRGGVFDEKPTYAVCVDPLSAADGGGDVRWRAEESGGAWTLVTDDLVVTLWLDPFRVDVHRTDGSVVVESLPDSEGRYWTYASLSVA